MSTMEARGGDSGGFSAWWGWGREWSRGKEEEEEEGSDILIVGVFWDIKKICDTSKKVVVQKTSPLNWNKDGIKTCSTNQCWAQRRSN